MRYLHFWDIRTFRNSTIRILRDTSTEAFKYSSNCTFWYPGNAHIPSFNMPASQHSRFPNIHVYQYSNTPTYELPDIVNIPFPTYLNVANIQISEYWNVADIQTLNDCRHCNIMIYVIPQISEHSNIPLLQIL